MKNNGEVEVANEGAKTFLAGAEGFFGFLALSNVTNNDERAALASEIDERGVHLADAGLAVLGAEVKLKVADFASSRKGVERDLALGVVHPEIHLAGSLVEDFFAGVASETREAIVDFDIGAVGERVDAEGVGTIAKGGGERLLRAAEGHFCGEQVVSGAKLLAVGEDEPRGGADNGGGDSEPSEDQLFTGYGAAHEDDEEGDNDGENLSGEEFADGRGGNKRGGLWLLPCGSQEDDDEERDHPEEVAPTGREAGADESEEVLSIGENKGEKGDRENQGEGAEPRRDSGAGPEEEGDG